jgi:hypothetical protein
MRSWRKNRRCAWRISKTGTHTKPDRVRHPVRLLMRALACLEWIILKKKMLSAYRESDKKYLASGGNAAATIKNSLLKRIGHYCTDQEREALGPTYCQSTVRSERNAGDSNAAPFLVNRNYGGAEVVTAGDYIDVLAPLPTITPEAEQIGGQLELMSARVRGAALSASRSAIMRVAVSGMGGDLQ